MTTDTINIIKNENIKTKLEANNIDYETVEFKGFEDIENAQYIIYESSSYIVKVKNVIISDVIKNDKTLFKALENNYYLNSEDEQLFNYILEGIEKRAWEKVINDCLIIIDKQKKTENEINNKIYYESIKKNDKNIKAKNIPTFKPIKYEKHYNANTKRNDYINISHPFAKGQIVLSQFLGFLDAGFLLLQHISTNNIKLEIDHIDRDKYNNHVSNLRVVSSSDNKKNRGPYNNYNLLCSVLSKNVIDDLSSSSSYEYSD